MNVIARGVGLDVATRAALLNHSDTNTVQRYDHLLPGEFDDARVKVRTALEGMTTLGETASPWGC